MTAIREQYGEGLIGEFFDFVHRVCDTERGLNMYWRYHTNWEADREIFPGPLNLNNIEIPNYYDQGAFYVKKFKLECVDVTLELLNAEKARVPDNDRFAAYVLEQAKVIYDAHDHEKCKTTYAPEPIQDIHRIPRLRGSEGIPVAQRK
jgi:hypothetical protein